MCQRPATYPSEIAATALAQRVGARVGATLVSPFYANHDPLGDGGLGGAGESSALAGTAYGDEASAGGLEGGGGGGISRAGYYYGGGGYERKDDAFGRGRRRATWRADRGDELIRGLERRFVESIASQSSAQWSGLADFRSLLQGGETAQMGGIGGGSGADGRGAVNETGGDGSRGTRRQMREGRECPGASVESPAEYPAPSSCPTTAGNGSGLGSPLVPTSTQIEMEFGEVAEREMGRGPAVGVVDVGQRREEDIICADAEGSPQAPAVRTTSGGGGGGLTLSKNGSGDRSNEGHGQVCSTPEGSSQSHLSSLESCLSNGSQYKGMEVAGSTTKIATDVTFEKGSGKADALSPLDGAASTTPAPLPQQVTACSNGPPVGSISWRMSAPLSTPMTFSSYGSSFPATSFPAYGGLSGSTMALRNNTMMQPKPDDTAQVVGLPARSLCTDTDPRVPWVHQRMTFLANGFASSVTPDMPDLATGGGSTPVKGFSEELGSLPIGGSQGAVEMSLPTMAQRRPHYCVDGLSNNIPSLAQGLSDGMVASHQEMMGYAATDGNASSDVEDVVIDEKKRRRMMSNRDSARRSRQRRQERLEQLERQAALLRVENSKLRSRTMSVTDQMLRYEEENKHLLEELMSLKEEVASLRRGGNGAMTGSGSDSGCESSGRDSEQCQTQQNQAQGLPKLHARMKERRGEANGLHAHEKEPANGVDGSAANCGPAPDTQRCAGGSATDESSRRIKDIANEGSVAKSVQDGQKVMTCSYCDVAPTHGMTSEKMSAALMTEVEEGILSELPKGGPLCTCGNHSAVSTTDDLEVLDEAEMLVMDEEMLGSGRRLGDGVVSRKDLGMTIADGSCNGQLQTADRGDCFLGYSIANAMSSSVTSGNFDSQGADVMMGTGNWILEELFSFNFETE